MDHHPDAVDDARDSDLDGGAGHDEDDDSGDHELPQKIIGLEPPVLLLVGSVHERKAFGPGHRYFGLFQEKVEADGYSDGVYDQCRDADDPELNDVPIGCARDGKIGVQVGL